MVYFVGAGTGAPDLITVRGKHLLEQADVIIYAGSLINRELLKYARKDCEIYNSAVLTLNEIVRIMKRAEEESKATVRLHTGDPSIYGAVREQMDELDQLGIPYESCPGVSACFGASSSLNLEYTLPGVSQSLIITRMEGRTKVPERESIESLASHQTSMAIYLSAGMLEELSRRLMAGGYQKETPAALVYKATWPEERSCICTVGTLYETAVRYEITKTALVLIGEAVAHRCYGKSKLYDPEFSTEFRQAEDILYSESRKTLSIISFTETGMLLSKKIAGELKDREVLLFTKWKNFADEGKKQFVQPVELSVGEWARVQMENKNALLFIGACGIAVRAVAPHLTDKMQDSPVLAMDETGKYVIPILSGHMGGANELAGYLAAKTGAEPVITTATDIQNKFAVDLFAKKNCLSIGNKDGIGKVSSRALAGKEITISIETGHWMGGFVPEGVCMVPYPPEGFVDVVVTSEERHFHTAVFLKPKEYVVGFGCKKGKKEEEMDAFIREKISRSGIFTAQIFALSSIRQKQEEEGIIQWCRKEQIPFVTYLAAELEEAEGDFQKSSFVKAAVGVDNVCERAALKACGPGGKLIDRKYAENGMTIAIGKREWMVEF